MRDDEFHAETATQLITDTTERTADASPEPEEAMACGKVRDYGVSRR